MSAAESGEKKEPAKKDDLEELKERLHHAVENEAFEEAAGLRDQIHSLEKPAAKRSAGPPKRQSAKKSAKKAK